MYLKRLKELREDSDLKQLAVANLLHITRQQYGLYESGKRSIPINYVKILAKFYNTSCDYILEETNDPKPYKKSSKKSKEFKILCFFSETGKVSIS